MADIKIPGLGFFYDPSGVTGTYSFNKDSGYYQASDFKLTWTGTNLDYRPGVAFIMPSSGTLTSLTEFDGSGNIQRQYTNFSYNIAPEDNGRSIDERMLLLTLGNDHWNGTDANEIFFYDPGSDTFNGYGGLDTVIVNFSVASDYSITKVGTSFQLKSINPSKSRIGEIDTLTNIERLEFTDKMVALDLDRNAGQAYRLYQAAFNRTPDLKGLGYWIGQMDKGAENLVQVANGFLNSVEFKQLYGDHTSDEIFLTALYQNVLHRVPDQAGFNYWEGRINDGMTRAGILASFSEGSENVAQVVGQISHGIEYIPYYAPVF